MFSGSFDLISLNNIVWSEERSCIVDQSVAIKAKLVRLLYLIFTEKFRSILNKCTQIKDIILLYYSLRSEKSV